MAEYSNGQTINVRVPLWMYEQVKKQGKMVGSDGRELGMGRIVRRALLLSGTVVKPDGKKKIKR